MFLILWDIKYIFIKTNKVSLRLLCFLFLWVRPETFIIPFLNFYLLSLYLLLIFIYPYNESAGILKLRPWCNIIDNISFPYKIYHLLHLSCEDFCIFWKFICTIYFCCCHNVRFFVSEKLSGSFSFFKLL